MIVLVGNKADLSEKRSVRASVFVQCTSSDTATSQVTIEEATAKSAQLNIMFTETSAKAGLNVKGLFTKIALSLPGLEKDGQADAQNIRMLNLFI